MGNTLPIVLPSDLQQLCLSDDLGREIGDVGVALEAFNTHIVKSALFEEKAFVARADHNFAAQDQIKAVVLDSPHVNHWVDHVIEVLAVEQVLVFLRGVIS